MIEQARSRNHWWRSAALVIVLVATALALAGLPMFGPLEFVGATTYLACRTVKGLRTPAPTTADAG
ncbi:hypothetical protein [Kitasatospora purpeofusca]|uniref:hypothetical protein n=1 Tax=Kitasatospora purpeofusca TaxID=67352 RepID=UPI003F4AC8DA